MNLALCTVFLVASVVTVSEPVPLVETDISLMNEVDRSLEIGIDWLRRQQQPDGSWNSYPAATALAVTAIANDPRGQNSQNQKAVERGVEYILSCVKPSGGIFKEDMEVYNTSIALMALLVVDPEKYRDVIDGARRRLLQLQYDGGEGATPESADFGGFGYDVDRRPDLSNAQWTLEALWMSERLQLEAPPGEPKRLEKPTPDLHWEAAIKFLERCQNLRSNNDQHWAGNDGGFIYRPGESKAGGTRSYGGMTYAGLKSFIYARLSRTDPRVQAAFNWIRNNYTVDENPGLGLQGLYYYYHTMAKALDTYGAEVIVDAEGVDHKWRGDLLTKLVTLQKGEGYWVNDNARWWENDPVLVTSYSLLAMQIASSVYR